MSSDLEDALKRARDAESAGQFFAAAFAYRDALGIASKLSDSATIKLCKAKSLEMNKKSTVDYKEISAETQIPTAEIRKIIDPILAAGDLTAILKMLGHHPFMCPDHEHIKKSSAKNMPLTYQIASISKISEEGHFVKGGDDPVSSWYVQQYCMSQGLISLLYLDPIFKELSEGGKWDAEKLMAYFEDTCIFPERILKVLGVGIERYFQGDYVSALHILVPQFEAFFLATSDKLGIDTIVLNRGEGVSTQTRTLSVSHLDSPAFQKVWDAKFCEQLKIVLFEPLGFALRHQIAHGEIQIEECTARNANLILYFFLRVAARIERKNK